MIDVVNKKLALFVCHDLIGLLIVNQLVPRLIMQGWRPSIFNTTNKRNRRVKVPAPAEPAFWGAGIVDGALLPFLDEASEELTQHDRKNYSYKELARKYDLDYLEVDDVNASEFHDLLNASDDLKGGISLRFLQLFDRRTIDLFNSKGFFWNLHGGLLPDYKGLLIPYRAIQNHENEYGWTLHKTETEIDEGAILTMSKLPLDSSKSIFELYRQMIPFGCDMICSTLEKFAHSPQEILGRKLSSDRDQSYYPYPTDQEMSNFTSQGIQFISSPIEHIEFLIESFTHSSSKHSMLLRNRLISTTREWVEHSEDQNVSNIKRAFAA